MSFLDRPRSVWFRRAIFRLHLWVGVLVALYVVVVSVTGAALVFRIQMQRAVYPELFTSSRDGPIADMATVVERVQAAYPRMRVSGVDAPTSDRPTHLAYVVDAERFEAVLIDPVTAEILGTLPDHPLVSWLQRLHFDLLAGDTGRVVNGIGATAVVLLVLTGVVVWWPGRSGWWRAAIVDWRRPWKRTTWELHGAVGIWTAVFTMLWAVTGLYFAFPATFRATVDRLSPLSVVASPQSVVPPGRSLTQGWRAVIDAARVHDGGHIARVLAPFDASGAFQVQFTDEQPTPTGAPALRPVYLNQYTGARLPTPATQPSVGDLMMRWVAPLHVGNFGGVGVRLAWMLFGLAPAVLAVTGLVLWWTRVAWPRLAPVPSD